MRKFRVALFAPEQDFYGSLLKSLSEGFHQRGHACAWQARHQPHDEVAAWARANKLDLVLEINRTLPREQSWPEGVAHACWLQDRRIGEQHLTKDFGKSDHIYFLADPVSYSLDMTGHRWSILSPAARPDVTPPQAPPGRCDFAFCGFIPQPMKAYVPVAVAADNSPVPLSRFLEVFPVAAASHINFTPAVMEKAIQETCERHGWRFIESAMSKFDEALIRTSERVALVDTLLAVSKNVELWGPDTWLRWPQFAPFYQGQLTVQALDTLVYQQARVNVHTGALALHFRLFDCLAAGGFMLVNETPYDNGAGGIAEILSDGVHYASYTMGTLKQTAERYLRDPEARLAISAEGRRKVLAEHTWAHRADQILADFSR